MFKNYLKIAWRNLWRNKFFSTINISGLALGMACSILIILWVKNELSIDSFHKNGSRLFAVYERQYYDNKAVGQYATPGVLANELKITFPIHAENPFKRVAVNEFQSTAAGQLNANDL